MYKTNWAYWFNDSSIIINDLFSIPHITFVFQTHFCSTPLIFFLVVRISPLYLTDCTCYALWHVNINTNMPACTLSHFSHVWLCGTPYTVACQASLFIGFSRKELEKAMAPTPVLLPGKSHGRRSLVGCSPWGVYKSDTNEQLHFRFSLSCTGGGNGNPLQGSYIENPRDGRAWWAAIYGVTQNQTWLKWLSSSSSKFHTILYLIPYLNTILNTVFK